MLRILSAADVRSTLTMQDAIQVVERGFIALSTGQAVVPVRGVLETKLGVTLTMPASVGAALSVKIVSVFADNAKLGLPVVNAAVLVLNPETGIPVAVIDGTTLTAVRTGAASGVATRHLAVEDAHILAVIGTGAQAATQIEAVCAVRPITEVRVFSRSGASAFVESMRSKIQADVRAVESVREATKGAHVITAATNSAKPVIHLADVAEGAHINGIGSFAPHMQEIAADIVQQAKIVVDHRPSAWAEAGDLIIPRDLGFIDEQTVYAEVGEIAAGHLPGRVEKNEITFFKSVGNAVQDAVVAQYLLQVAENKNLGTIVPF